MMSARTSRVVLVVAIAAGFILRLREARESSLWLDELHSIVHAWKPADVAGVLEHVHWDFHAPLFFVVLHFVRTQEPELARLLTIVSSLLVLVPLLWFARRSRLGTSAPAIAAALFAFLPFQIQCATELRPYAFLMVASACACWAAFADSGSARFRFAAFALAVAFGLNTHYLMALVVLLIGAVRVLFLVPPLARGAPGPRPLGLAWLILAGALGACAFLPWFFGYMFWVVETPEDLVPGDAAERTVTTANFVDVLQAPLKTLVPAIRLLGGGATLAAGVGAAILVAGLVLGVLGWLVRALRRDLPPADRSVRMAVAFAALAGVVVCGMSIWSWARVSVRYLWIAAWLWPLVACELVAAFRSPRARAALAALLVGGAALAGVAHVVGKTREDVRGAVARARFLGVEFALLTQHRPLYTALLGQPPRFEHGLPYLAYGADLDWVEPKDLPRPGQPGFERPVVVITRQWRDLDTVAIADAATLRAYPVDRIREGRAKRAYSSSDEAMSVWVFAPEVR
jgi:hypothetical protein